MPNNNAARDPYLWQHDDVLKNRLEIHDTAQLRKAELAFSAARLATLELSPVAIGLPFLRHIHRTLFQDVYDWAGELRTIDIWRDDTPVCHFEYIEKEGNVLMDALEQEAGLRDLPQETFAARLAHYYCEMDMLHPFRAGNGRVLRLFLEQLALHAGYLLTWQSVSAEAWQEASQQAAAGDAEPLSALFTRIVTSHQAAKAVE